MIVLLYVCMIVKVHDCELSRTMYDLFSGSVTVSLQFVQTCAIMGILKRFGHSIGLRHFLGQLQTCRTWAGYIPCHDVALHRRFGACPVCFGELAISQQRDFFSKVQVTPAKTFLRCISERSKYGGKYLPAGALVTNL